VNKERILEIYKMLGIKSYDNPRCKDCNECCGTITVVTVAEFKSLMKYLLEVGAGRMIYEKAKKRWNKQLLIDDLKKVCPFSNENKRCDIYAFRPGICREFHCNLEFIKERNNNIKEYMDQGFYEISDFFKPATEITASYIRVEERRKG